MQHPLKYTAAHAAKSIMQASLITARSKPESAGSADAAHSSMRGTLDHALLHHMRVPRPTRAGGCGATCMHPRTWLSLFRTSACGSWMRCARCAISTRAYGSISRARFLHANHFYEIRPESIVRI